MKINANEMLLINKNLKFKGEEAENAGSAAALAEVPEVENSISALNAQSMNNIAFQGVNLSGLKKMGLSAMIALTMLGGAASMTSCQSDEPEIIEKPVTPPQVIINITNNIKISVTVNMTDDELVAAILAEQARLIKLIEQMHKDQQANHEEQMEVNKAILAELVKQGISLDKIITLLDKMNMTAEDLLNYAKENADKQDAILNEITNGNAEQKAIMLEILKSIEKGNSISTENNVLLTKLIVQMGQADQNDKTIIALLNKILNKVNESIQTNKAIAAQQQLLLQAILGKLSALDNNMKQGILAILDKIDSVSEANITLLTKIFNSIEEGNKNDEQTNEILKAIYNKVDESIKQNHEMTEKTHELLWMIMDKISNLDDNMKASILALLNKIDSVSEANITLLTKIFNSIDESNKNDKETNEILKAIYNKVDESIKQNHEMTEKTHELLWMIMDKMDKMNADMKANILAIIDKIDASNDITVELLTKILVSIDASSGNNDKTNELLLKILEKMDKLNDDMKANILTILNKIDSVSEANITLLTKILNAVNEGSNNNKETNELLKAIYNKVDESIKQNHEMTEKTHELLWMVIDKISKLDDNMKVGFEAIIKNINSASENNIELLIKLINKVDNMQGGDNETSKVLNAILAKIQESIDTNKEMDTKTHQLLQSILDNVQNFNGDLKTAVEAILAKMDKISAENKILLGDILNNIQNMNGDMKDGFAAIIENMDKVSAEHKAFYQEILARLDKLDDNAQKGLGLLLEQLEKNNAISADMLNKINVIIDKLDKAHEDDVKFHNQAIALLSELVSKVDQLGGKADAILDAIANISIDAGVDLSKIEKMLEDLLAQSQANGDVLTSIDSKMNLMAITLEGIKTQIEVLGGDNKAILKKLDEILAKIPDKCNCDASLKVIIEKLDKIVEELKKGNNHEGILDDLDKFFE